MLRTLLVLVVLFAPMALGAQESPRTSCADAKTTIEVRRCISHDLQAAERDLDRYLQEARRRAASRALLDSAQIAWKHYRDLTCRAAGSEPGTTQPPAVLDCLLGLTRRRIHELYDHYLRKNVTALPEPEP